MHNTGAYFQSHAEVNLCGSFCSRMQNGTEEKLRETSFGHFQRSMFHWLQGTDGFRGKLGFSWMCSCSRRQQEWNLFQGILVSLQEPLREQRCVFAILPLYPFPAINAALAQVIDSTTCHHLNWRQNCFCRQCVVCNGISDRVALCLLGEFKAPIRLTSRPVIDVISHRSAAASTVNIVAC